MEYHIIDKSRVNQFGIMLEHLVVMLMICGLIAFAEQRKIFIATELLFFLVMGIRLLHKKLPIIYIVWGSMFLMWGLMSTLWAYNVNLVFIDLKAIAQMIVIGFFLISFMDTEQKNEYILKCFIFGAVMLVLRLMLTTDLSLWGTERLGTSIGYNANTIGIVLGYAALFSVYIKQKCKKRTYDLIAMAFFIVVLFTGSRKAFILCIVGISMIYMLTAKNRSRTIINLLLALIGGIIAYEAIMNIPVLYDVLGSRMEGLMATVSGENVEYSTLYRLEMMERAKVLFKEQPLKGYGFANFALIGGFGCYSHNNYMEILCGGGIIALVIYYSLPIMVLSKSIKQWIEGYKQQALVIVVIILMLILDVGNVSYHGEITQIVIAISVGKYNITSRRILIK